jgi:hypothetical protein
MTQETPSRRAWLRRVTVTAAVIGGVSGTVAGSGADGESKVTEVATDGGKHDEGVACPDSATVDVRLTPACADADRDRAVFCVTNDGLEPVTLEWRPVAPPEERIEFVDCQTVRVVGEFVDVILEATFLSGGEIGNVIEPVGEVDGVRTFDVRELDQIPDDAIIGTAEAFRDDPVVPGAGDLTASNPEFDACQEEFFGEVLVGDGSAETDDGAATDEDARTRPDEERGRDDPADDELEGLTVPAESTACFTVDAPAGLIAVQLFREGELLVERTSAADVACPTSIPDDGTLSTTLPDDWS